MARAIRRAKTVVKPFPVRATKFRFTPVLPQPKPWDFGVTNLLEARVAQALERLGYMFVPQVSFFGGGGWPGGSRVDFYLPNENTIIRVQGPFHETLQAQARDTANAIALKAAGKLVVDIWHYEAETVEQAVRVLSERIGRPVA